MSRDWVARLAVGGVFGVNVWCALEFVARPEWYLAAFEVSGTPGRVVVQSLGILFLMWNVTYPPVIWQPARHRALWGVILVQQAIGVAGETALWLSLPPGHAALSATGLRFMVFDACGLLVMGAVLAWHWRGLNRVVA